MTEERKSWERQDFETAIAYAAFEVYRDMGAGRKLSAIPAVLGKPPVYKRQIETFSSKYSWVQRCREYDDYCDRRNRAENEAAKRIAYQQRLEKYWSDKEQIARADFNIVVRAKQLVQQQLNFYLQNPAPMRLGDVSALLRSVIALHESADASMRLVLEYEAGGQQAVESEAILLNSDDPAELVKEHQRLLDELDSD